MYIHRDIENLIKKYVKQGKILIIYGARQVGKTTMLGELFPSDSDTLFLSCDERRVQEKLAPDSLALKQLFGNARLVILDEAHQVPEIGRVLKIAADHLKDMQIIATGSAAFELKNTLSEPLTGRHFAFTLSPLTFRELTQGEPRVNDETRLQELMIYGSYPNVATVPGSEDKILRLRSIVDNYLFKDILAFDRVKHSEPLRHLVAALALQLGNEVSYHELGKKIGLSYKTVERYITLLEQSFIIFRLRAFSRNQRNELSRKVKIYFYDCGVRNAIINLFNPLNLRTDAGALFENAMIADRIKRELNMAQPANLYFWRSYSQQEVDLITEKNGQLSSFEFKLSSRPEIRPPREFAVNYPDASFSIIAFNDAGARNRFLGVD